MASRAPLTLLTGLLVGLVPAVASATTLQQLSVSELTYVADLVVEADVVANQVERKAGHEYLQTVTTLQLTHVLKGERAEGDLVDVVVLGGTKGEERTELPGAPKFAPDERVVVFLEWKFGEWRLIGLSQSKFTVVEEVGTGRDAVVKMHVPEGLARFEEAEVQLPAVVDYLDTLVEQVADELAAGYVPPYINITGLEPDKDARFRADARAFGHEVDARWDTPEHNMSVRTQLAREAAAAQLPQEVIR